MFVRKCDCIFVADKTETKYSLGTDYVVCPFCGNDRELTWKYGEPYEETTPTLTDRERLAQLIGETPDVKVWPDAKLKITDNLIANGVTFREG